MNNILSKEQSEVFEKQLCPECHKKILSFCEKITELEQSDKVLDRLKKKTEMLKFPLLYKRLCKDCTKKFINLIKIPK